VGPLCDEFQMLFEILGEIGIARIRLLDSSVHLAELHWYEAAGIGRKEFKIKHLL